MQNITNGKFQVYYDRLSRIVTGIKNEKDYNNLSKAFIHWYLKNVLDMDEEAIVESMIDGSNDNGVDAIVLEDDTLHLYQFKFPKIEGINNHIDDTTALKLISGYQKLVSNEKPILSNEGFLKFRNIVKDNNIFYYKLCFISYNSGLTSHAIDTLNIQLNSIKSVSGNTIEHITIDKNMLCEKLDIIERKNNININLKYTSLVQGYNMNNDGVVTDSWIGYARANDILKSCDENLANIFDENIRNYEGDNSINSGIIRTATDENESKNFYFYHNGIVFICNSANNSAGNQTIALTSASVVNGCQTLMSLKKAQSISDNVFIPIRVIVTSNTILRNNITEYLNSQTKIKDSYFLANNSFIRELQKELDKSGYFLERLANEYRHKHSQKKLNEYPEDKILKLDDTLQIYTACYHNEYAVTAKAGKGKLFNDRSIMEKILPSVKAEHIINSLRIYNIISQYVSLYRKCKRNYRYSDFLNKINIKQKTDDENFDLMQKYMFMNSGDLMILNGYQNLKNKSDTNIDIQRVISVIYDIVNSDKTIVHSNATKSPKIYSDVQEKCKTL